MTWKAEFWQRKYADRIVVLVDIFALACFVCTLLAPKDRELAVRLH